MEPLCWASRHCRVCSGAHCAEGHMALRKPHAGPAGAGQAAPMTYPTSRADRKSCHHWRTPSAGMAHPVPAKSHMLGKVKPAAMNEHCTPHKSGERLRVGKGPAGHVCQSCFIRMAAPSLRASDVLEGRQRYPCVPVLFWKDGSAILACTAYEGQRSACVCKHASGTTV